MKFIHQQLDVREIERRIREEECRTGKRVTEVLLKPAEWVEFMRTTGYTHAGYVRIPRRTNRMPALRCFTGECACCAPDEPVDFYTITVRPE